MFDETYQSDVNEEKMSNEEWDEGEANCEDNELKFSGLMSEKVLIDVGKPEPIIPIKIESSDQLAPHIYSGARELMGKRETTNSLTLENKDKNDLIAETKRSTKVNHGSTEFEGILGRKATVLLERCALPSSPSAPTKYFNIENESDDENNLSGETEGEKQKKISEKAEERVLHDSDGAGKFKQFEVTIQRETHAQCKEEPRECEEFNFVAESKRAKDMHYCLEFNSIIKRRAIVVLERCCASSCASSRAPIKDCKIKNEIDNEFSFSTEIKDEMQNEVIETAAEDGLGGPDAEGKCRQVEDTRKIETCAQPNKCMETTAERLLVRETQERQKHNATVLENWRKKLERETPEQSKKRRAFQAEKKRKMRENETPEQRQKHNAAVLENWRKKLERETPEQSKKRRAVQGEKKRKMRENETPEQRQKRLAKQAEYSRRYAVKIRLEREKSLAAGTERRTEAVDRDTYEKLEKCHLTVPERCKRVIKLDSTVLKDAGLSPQDGNANNNIKNEPIDLEVGNIKTKSEDGNKKDFSSKDVNETNLISTQSKADNENEGFDFSSQHISGHVIKSKAMASLAEDEKNEMEIVFECFSTNAESLSTKKALETAKQHRCVLSKDIAEEHKKRWDKYVGFRKIQEEMPNKVIETTADDGLGGSDVARKCRQVEDTRKIEACTQQNKCMATNTEMLSAKETQEHQKCHAADVESWRKRMVNKSPEQHNAAVLKKWRKRLERETPEQRKHRLALIAEWKRKIKENETPEQRQKRLVDLAEKKKKIRENETPEQRQKHNAAALENWRKRLERETPEQRKKRLAVHAELQRKKRENETPEQRQKHNAAALKRWRKKLEKETPEQRKKRLAVRQRKIRENETPEQLTKQMECHRRRIIKIRQEPEKCLAAGTEKRRMKTIDRETSQQLENCHLAVAESCERVRKLEDANEKDFSSKDVNETNFISTQSKAENEGFDFSSQHSNGQVITTASVAEEAAECFPTNAESSTTKKTPETAKQYQGFLAREVRAEETAEPLEKYLARQFTRKETLEQHNQYVADGTENYTERIERDMLGRRENQEETYYVKSFVRETLEQHDCSATDTERKEKAMERKKLEHSMRQTEKYRRRKARESPEQRSKRRVAAVEWGRRSLKSETPEHRKNRLAKQAEYRRKIRESETPEQRKERQAAKEEARKKAKQRETAEQWHERLSKEAEYRRRAKERELADPEYRATTAKKNVRKQMRNETQVRYAERKILPKPAPENCKNHLAVIIECNRKTMEAESFQSLQKSHLAVAEKYNGVVMRLLYINEEGLSPQVGNTNNNGFNIQSEPMNEDRGEYSAQDGNMIKIKSEETNEENLSSENANVVIKSEVVDETEEVNFWLQRDVIGTNGIKSEDTAAVEDKNDEIEIDFEAYLHPKTEMSW